MIARFPVADLATTSSFWLDYGRVAAHNIDLICLVRRHYNFCIYCTVASTSFAELQWLHTSGFAFCFRGVSTVKPAYGYD